MSTHDRMMRTNYQSQPPQEARFISEEYEDGVRGFFVSPTWLKQAIDRKLPNLVIVEVTRGGGDYRLDEDRSYADYVKGHIPGAVHLSTAELGEFKDYFKSAEELRDVFLSKGITKDSLVVFYSIYARDIMYIASRMAFAAYYLGVDQVKILDGGLQAWERAGYPLEKGEVESKPQKAFGCPVPKRPEIYIRTPDDLIEARTRLQDNVLASVRTWKEYIGDNAGHAWNGKSGEIIGAVYAGDEKLTNVGGYVTDPSYYLDDWKKWGIRADRSIILYCGTSWRSSTAFFIMKSLGFPEVSMFDGSWYKWQQAHQEDPARYPIQKGNPLTGEGYEVDPNV